MLAPGYLIGGRYRLVRLLGEGGMGAVWSAVNDAFGREVAIKVMLPGVAAGDPTAIDRFFTEARICGTIRDPGIVDVLDVGKLEDGAPFLVMELLDGDSLDTILHRSGTLRPIEVLPVLRDVARTLGLAHANGVIHRDLKPGNVFLHRLPSGQIVAKVLDFGVSKVTSPDKKATLTQTGTVCGSPAYMSPEQAGGRLELDPRSDIYGLGVILYECMAGRLPFLEQNYNALMIDIAVREPPPLSEVAPKLPKAVHDLVAAAMVHDREGRIPTSEALADRIEATLVALGATATHPLPDPTSLLAVAPPASRRVISSAQTSSALATNANYRARRSRRLSTFVVLAVATLFVGFGSGTVYMKLRRRPPVQAAVAPPGINEAPSPDGTADPAASGAPADPPPSASASGAPGPPSSAFSSAAPSSSARFWPKSGKGTGKKPPGTTGTNKDPTFGF